MSGSTECMMATEHFVFNLVFFECVSLLMYELTMPCAFFGGVIYLLYLQPPAIARGSEFFSEIAGLRFNVIKIQMPFVCGQ